MQIFSLTAAALEGELWRLWTGHLAHWSLEHLLLNLAALLPVLVIMRRRFRLLMLWSLGAAPLISACVLFATPEVEYRGASALALGGWFLAGLLFRNSQLRRERTFAYVLLVIGVAKLLLETTGWFPATTDVPSSLTAHWAGAIAGILSAAIMRKVAEVSNLGAAEQSAALPIQKDLRRSAAVFMK